MNCMPPAGANVHHKGAEIANSMRLAASARCLAQRTGASSTTSAASAGHASSAVTTHWRYIRLPHHRADHGQDTDYEQDDVHTHLARLQPAPQPSEGPRRRRAPVHEQAVHETRVDDLPEHFTREPHHRSHDDRVVELV